MSVSFHPPPSILIPLPACEHCGLPSPPPSGDDSLAFCCNGCRGAYELIRGWGLEDFYALRDDSGGNTAVDQDANRFDDLDHPDLLGLSAPVVVRGESGPQFLRSRLTISGLHCAACLWLLERAPVRVDGWFSSHVRMHARTIDITFDPTKVRLSEIASLLLKLGYQVSPLGNTTEDEAANAESRQLLVSIAIAGFCAANAMWLAIALYAGSYTGIDSGHAGVFRIAGVLLGCVAVIFPGRTFFRGALASIQTRTPHMDLPVALGLAAGLLGSLYGLLDSTREVYFDSIASLVFFLLVGRWLQMRGQRRAGDEVAGLIALTPQIASRRESDGSVKRVPASELTMGDRVVVGAGESIPVDGSVVDGVSMVDRSLLTGESDPVPVREGTEVSAGTENLQSTIDVRATLVGPATQLGQLTNAVSDAAASRTPVVQMANRIGGWFVAIVLCLAGVTGWIWWQRDPGSAIGHVVSLLIVACPCALALATPLAIAASIGRLAGRKVLVRSGECLERLIGSGTIFFDKTGTLTAGKMRVVGWSGELRWLSLAAAAEANIKHPIATAVTAYAAERGAGNNAARGNEAGDTMGGSTIGSVRVLPGQGIEFETNDSGTVRIGNATLLDAITSSGGISDTFLEAANRVQIQGASPIYLVANGKLEAVFGAADTIREDAKPVVDFFQRQGWRVGILSGDHEATVSRVASELGIESANARGGLLPNDKLIAIRQAASADVVMMVGDGMNDAAALAAADVGVAIRGGAGASLAAAPVIIGNGRLEGLISLISMARITRSTIRRNFLLSITYNAVAVVLAMTGWITPLIAAILMPISSLTVIIATVAGIRFQDDPCLSESANEVSP